MSEEKLYAVKDDKGKYWDFEDQDGFWELNTMNLAAIAGKEVAECVAHDHGGHVVTLIEEPKKVVVSPNEAQAIKSLLNANTYADVYDPFQYLFTSRYKKDIKRLSEAIKNGYTVAKEKKYLVYKELGGKQKHEQFAQAYRSSVYPGTISWILTNDVENRSFAQFAESEIAHYGLQDCEKEEVTDDEQ
ncbi:DUF1642 domain-containing protein [Lacticaseibacillus paracasei]|uniref:DUF1642 domain-containing protein n=1 Tax=Lacticaseibacillus paracasei TaxID=1597 RepID=UPI000F0BCF98|nr:DUF1642 domain-containing protein [Lacticaseibacillus paracasei]RNE19129.1 hypothetical protein FAM3257_02198 [Lacticaseibacillus paracasei]TLQ35200.1 DUF1642 domain-containing protein [Lacticaseibacillus paracasei]